MYISPVLFWIIFVLYALGVLGRLAYLAVSDYPRSMNIAAPYDVIKMVIMLTIVLWMLFDR